KKLLIEDMQQFTSVITQFIVQQYQDNNTLPTKKPKIIQDSSLQQIQNQFLGPVFSSK
ncbi:6521_t:CDS:1, partial [Gigaspora margarita]